MATLQSEKLHLALLQGLSVLGSQTRGFLTHHCVDVSFLALRQQIVT